MPLEHGIILNKEGELYKKLELLRRENELALDRNIICRMGFIKSLDEPGIPSWEEYKDCFSTENNSGTFQIKKDVLTGRLHSIFIALLKQRLVEDLDFPPSDNLIEQHFKAHIARGVLRILYTRSRKLSRIRELL